MSSAFSTGTRRHVPGLRYAPQVVLLAAMWIYFIATSDTFRGTSAVYPVLQSFALLGVVALGIGLTMIVGELDLSVGSMAALSGVVAITFSDLGLLPAAVIAVGFGALYGLLQGIIITRLGISSLAVTIASLIMLKGIALAITSEAPISANDLSLGEPLLQRFWLLSTGSLVAVVLFVLVGFFMSYTRLGHEMYATGGARDEARAAGARTGLSVVTAFVLSGAFSALAGTLVALGSGVASPTNFSTLLLAAPTAVLVGGVALTGGRGTVVNIALGVAIISLISSGTADQGLQPSVAQLVTGALLVAVVAIEFGRKRLNVGRESRGAGPRDRIALTPTEPPLLSSDGNRSGTA